MEFRVFVELSEATRDTLNAEGWNFYVAKAVKANPKGDPLIWAKVSGGFLEELEVSWDTRYCAYVARDAAAADAGGAVHETIVRLEPGQEWNAPDPSRIYPGLRPDAVAITSDSSFSCGLAQSESGDEPAAVCALPLTAGYKVEIIPLHTILLMFSAEYLPTGQLVRTCSGPAVMVDVTDAPARERSLTYDMAAGWNAPGGGLPPWATPVPINADLRSLLVAPIGGGAI